MNERRGAKRGIFGRTYTRQSRPSKSHLLDVFHGLNDPAVVVGLYVRESRIEVIPDVSTMVVVRLLSIPGGMVIIGTMVCMFEMNVSFTNEVMRLQVRQRKKVVNT